ncbi:hypothetical protein Sste5346_009860 [Sporothrix stenoceras]|uniref:Zn(2)-C6 fungal-type domain-containing protein n=1 Tax=Sporothrix stenoceras TaxID=5173 RepID=A0ABR3YI25_9PEZI
MTPPDISEATPPSPQPASKTAALRKYGFSCLACRRRKIRCDGHRPTCRGCSRSGEPCVYQAHDASVSRLSHALERSEARVAELQESLRGAESLNLLSSQARIATAGHAEFTTGPGPVLAAPCSLPVDEKDSAVTKRHELDSAGKTSLIVDEHGTLHYYGATSRFHLFGAANQTAGGTVTPPVVATDEAYHRRWLLSNARFQASWDRAALANLRKLTVGDDDDGPDPEIATTLLQIYWTWQAPLHNYVYRRCFSRDMALGGEGPYFSAFLLNVIFAHACRHSNAGDARFDRYDKGEVFLRRAKMLLLAEMDEDKPRIPTIQGLLLLGGRQCAVGKNAQGWLYTGMAIRMIQHLGLHLPKSRSSLLERLEPDDLEARKRLYLSAYVWDKSISLCLGRPPSLPDMPYPPMPLFDSSDDDDMWYPFYLDNEGRNTYQPTPSYNTTTFLHFCELAKIINEMYDTVYNRRPDHIDQDGIVHLETKFRAFYRSLPAKIRVDDVEALPFCPPPHIVSLNILYHTSLILLYRPSFLLAINQVHHNNASRTPATPPSLLALSQHICTDEAAKVNSFFRAYGRAFMFRHQTYLTSYCVYTAATIEVQQVRHPDPAVATQAVERLGTTLRMLEVESQQTPGIRRSIDIIKAQLGGAAAAAAAVATTGNMAPVVDTHQSLAPTQVLPIGDKDTSRPAVGPAVDLNVLIRDEGQAAQLPLAYEQQVQQLGPPGLGPTVSAVQPNEDFNTFFVPGDTEETFKPGMLDATWFPWYIPDAGGGFIPNLDV